MESTLIAYWGHIAPYMPDLDTVVSIVAIVALISCWPLIALGILGILNVLCRWKLKAEGVTDEDMADLQRRMLGYVAKNPKEVERLYRCMQVWGGNKVANRRKHEIRAMPKAVNIMPMPTNVIYFDDWRDDHRVEATEAAE